jgi:hypothetical protein
LKEVGEPEGRVPDVGLLVLQPVDRAANFAQQPGSIDLGFQIAAIELLDGPGNRSQCREVLPRALDVETAEPPVLRDEARGAGRCRIEMVLEIQVGPAEVVDGLRSLALRYAQVSLMA